MLYGLTREMFEERKDEMVEHLEGMHKIGFSVSCTSSIDAVIVIGSVGSMSRLILPCRSVHFFRLKVHWLRHGCLPYHGPNARGM
jgi:hypothetical protein